jgi:predicted ATPase
MIDADALGKPRTAFRYFDKGDMATIGRHMAVADVRWPFYARLSGYPAWLAWLSIHLFFLAGFRNGASVFLSWDSHSCRGRKLLVSSRRSQQARTLITTEKASVTNCDFKGEHNALDIFGAVDTLDIAAHSGSDRSPAPYDAGCDAVAASEIRVNRCVVISGCSGGGKSKLLAELGRRGYTVIEEPGRRIVTEEMNNGGSVLPWVDMAAFAHRVIAMALADRSSAPAAGGWIFFDRSLIDAAVDLQRLTHKPVLEQFGQTHRYHRCVFLAPPWPELYMIDRERRHTPAVAVVEYYRLFKTYPSLGYEVFILPKVGVVERADFVLRTLEEQPSLSASPAKVDSNGPTAKRLTTT